jgi:hypothetical protein
VTPPRDYPLGRVELGRGVRRLPPDEVLAALREHARWHRRPLSRARARWLLGLLDGRLCYQSGFEMRTGHRLRLTTTARPFVTTVTISRRPAKPKAK